MSMGEIAFPAVPVEVVVPQRRTADLGDVLRALVEASPAEPFAPERLAFVADLSRALAKRGRGLPETQALAFWMRKAELARMADDLPRLAGPDVRLMPRGTVFHIPPANVDTLFVYSLVLSVLAGNRNIVRLSSRTTDQSNLIIDTIDEVLRDHPQVADATAMLTYGHDDAITAAISGICDTRVIWGGDATVAAIRRVALPPHATELTFPDRFSMAAIGTKAYSDMSADARDDLAEQFFNDAYWFDQLGCSSPRLVVWVGEAADALAGPEVEAGATTTDALAEDFHQRVLDVIERKGYAVDTSAAIAKLGQSMRSIIDDDVTAYRRYDNALTVLDVAGFPDARGDFCGAGLFYEVRLPRLVDLAPHISRADQTLAVHGVPRADIDALVTALCGRGIDRIVPFGQALAFNRIWDGHDLLAELMRRVTVSVAAD